MRATSIFFFDCYFENTSKVDTESNRGTRARQKVTGNGMLPSNWEIFICCSENKKELFSFLSNKTVYELFIYKIVVATVDNNVLSNQSFYLDYIMSCSLQESDKSMLLYFNSASNQFSKQLTVILLLFQVQFLIDWKVLMSCRQNSEEEKPYDVYRFSHRRSGYSRPKSSLFLL